MNKRTDKHTKKITERLVKNEPYAKKKNKIKKENRHHSESAEVALSSFDFMGNLEVGLKVIMIVIALTLVTLFFIFVENAATQSHIFSLKKISVSGNTALSNNEIIEQTGLVQGENILSLNLGHVRERLLSHPWIKDASITRVMPSELAISIKEEKAVAVARMDGMADLLINSKGEPFSENDGIGNEIYTTLDIDHSSHPLPVIRGLKLTKVMIGSKKIYEFTGKLHKSVIELLHMETKEYIQGISADPETGIEINAVIHQSFFNNPSDEQPIKIKLGFDNFQESFKKIRHIVKYVQKNNFHKQICSIDLINPENIVIKIKDGDALPESQQGGV